MNNSSLAELAIAMGPGSPAPPSFDGHGWLVVANLAVFTAMFVIATMFAADQVKMLWRNRKRDTWAHPVTIWRLLGLCLFLHGTLRYGTGAAVLWIWNPVDPESTAAALTMQRFIDPLAALFGLAAMCLFTLSAKGLVAQLRREPLEVDIWLSLPMLRRPALIAVASLVAAIGVVSLR